MKLLTVTITKPSTVVKIKLIITSYQPIITYLEILNIIQYYSKLRATEYRFKSFCRPAWILFTAALNSLQSQLTDGKRLTQHKSQETNKAKQITIRNLKRNNVNKAIRRALKVNSGNKDMERPTTYLHTSFIMNKKKTTHKQGLKEKG